MLQLTARIRETTSVGHLDSMNFMYQARETWKCLLTLVNLYLTQFILISAADGFAI
jgi:hypothetical protein